MALTVYLLLYNGSNWRSFVPCVEEKASHLEALGQIHDITRELAPPLPAFYENDVNSLRQGFILNFFFHYHAVFAILCRFMCTLHGVN